jgi:hypothetical protein
MSKRRTHDPPVLVHSPDPISFSLLIEKTARAGDEPDTERREALIDIPAHSVKCLTRTGARLQEIVNWLHEHFPTLSEKARSVNNISVPALPLISPRALNYMRIPLRTDPEG